MPDEREELNNIGQDPGYDTYIPGDEELFFDAETPVPSVIKSLDDALKAVDNSDTMPVPVNRSPNVNRYRDDTAADNTVIIDDSKWQKRPSSEAGKRVDKYGLPIKEPEKPVSSLRSAPAAISMGISKMLGNIRPSATEQAVSTKQADFPVDPEKIFAPEQDASGAESLKLLGETARDVSMPNFNKTKAEKNQKEFKVMFDFESAYKDPPEDRPLRFRRERRTGLVGGLLFALFILSVALVLAAVMWMATVDVLGFASEDLEVNISVPEEFTMEAITDMLYEAGLVQYKTLFSIYADYSNAEEKISPGSYVLNMNYDYRALVQGMTARAGIRVETTVTIPEGFTLAQIFNLLEDEGVCTTEELWDTATHHDFDFYFLEKETLGNRLRLEGFLFPDTYNFYKDSTAVQAINRMLREFDNKFIEQYVERADAMGYTIREIVTVASMIEREAGNDEERPRIAAVIYNRLNNPSEFPMLEIDATINYAIAGTGIPWSTSVDSEYNTYMHEGLPPGPIANPGLASIRAALYPSETNEFFYALNRNGTHNFFRNATDHINFVNSDEYGG